MSCEVSIIIPTFNRSHLVVQTIDSVLRQTFEDYEVIVVDDGSTDDTREVLQKFSELTDFHYLYQSNAGRSLARNAGMEKSAGKYLMFLDSDDLLSKKALEYFSDTYRKFPESGIVAGCRKFVDENGNRLESFDPVKVETALFAASVHVGKIREVFFPPSTYVVKKEIAKKVKGFDKSMEPAEDFDFFIKCCDVAKISIIEKDVVFMRRHDNNTPDTDLRKAALKISQKNFGRLAANPDLYDAQLLQEMKTEWQIRMADDLYALKRNSESRSHYWQAIRISPKLLGNARIIKQIIGTLLPQVLKEKVRR